MLTPLLLLMFFFVQVDSQLGKAAETAIDALVLKQKLTRASLRRIRRPSMCSHRLLLPLLLLLLLTLPTQVDPQLGKAAETAIDALIKELPQDLVEQAQQYRVARANGKA